MDKSIWRQKTIVFSINLCFYFLRFFFFMGGGRGQMGEGRGRRERRGKLHYLFLRTHIGLEDGVIHFSIAFHSHDNNQTFPVAAPRVDSPCLSLTSACTSSHLRFFHGGGRNAHHVLGSHWERERWRERERLQLWSGSFPRSPEKRPFLCDKGLWRICISSLLHKWRKPGVGGTDRRGSGGEEQTAMHAKDLGKCKLHFLWCRRHDP